MRNACKIVCLCDIDPIKESFRECQFSYSWANDFNNICDYRKTGILEPYLCTSDEAIDDQTTKME